MAMDIRKNKQKCVHVQVAKYFYSPLKTGEIQLLNDTLGRFLGTENYCFDDSSDETPVNWKLQICNYEDFISFKENFQLSGMYPIFKRIPEISRDQFLQVGFIAALLMAIIIVIYFAIGDFGNLPGKCVIFFTTGLMLILAALPLSNGFGCLVLGMLLSFLWLSVMTFDIWLTFR